jgi:TRAP-type mannitol/chloroaromatic compound transport system permease small subunit
MRVLHGYRRVAGVLSETLGWISALLVVVTVVVGVTNVVLREIGSRTNRSLTNNALIEAQWYLYTLVFVTGLAYILKNGINVRVDFWFANRSERTRSIIDLVGHLVGLLPFCYIAIKYSWPAVQFSWEVNEQSPDPSGLPRAPIKTALLLGFVFLTVQAIAEVIKTIEELGGYERRDEPDAPALAAGQEYEITDFAVDLQEELARSERSET